MNKTEAKRLATLLSNVELLSMFDNAKLKITDWTKVSIVNKGMTKGTAWNILAKDFDIEKKYHNLTKVNMIREFGDFLPNYEKPVKKIKAIINPVHQEPKFE
jgi:hypothetical protein